MTDDLKARRLEAFRAVLKASPFYNDWRTKFGDAAWTALQTDSGPLA